MTGTILYGGITHHYIGSDIKYCNQINNVGTIHNEYVIAMVGDDNKFGFLKGKDSACGDIYGIISSFKLRSNVDFVLGGYNTNFKEFRELEIKPISIANVTPVIGFNYKILLYKNKDFSIGIDNIVSFGIISHALSLNF